MNWGEKSTENGLVRNQLISNDNAKAPEMKCSEHIIDFDDCAQKLGFLSRLGALSGKWRFSVRPYRALRSLKANAYYWAVVVQAFREFLARHNQFFSNEEVHEFLLQQHASRIVIDPNTGEAMSAIGRRSSEMDSAEFAQYVDRCKLWMFDRFGIVVPEPEVLVGKRKAS